MDPNDDLELVDSGMGSLTNSKDDTPESKSELEIASDQPFGQLARPGDIGAGDYDDEPDETLSERLWGLTEIFPEVIRNATDAVATNSCNLLKIVYSLTRTISWVVLSSSVILFAPVVFEVERAQMDEMQRTQQKQVLFGLPTGGMPAMPPLQR